MKRVTTITKNITIVNMIITISTVPIIVITIDIIIITIIITMQRPLERGTARSSKLHFCRPPSLSVVERLCDYSGCPQMHCSTWIIIHNWVISAVKLYKYFEINVQFFPEDQLCYDHLLTVFLCETY